MRQPGHMLSKSRHPAIKRRSLLATVALGATFALALGLGAPAASAQGRSDDGRDYERSRIDRYGDADRYRVRDGERYRDDDRRSDDKRKERWDAKDDKDDGKPDGKRDGKRAKSGHIKLEVESGGGTSVDVKCADDESMRACADITKELIDKLRAAPAKAP